MKNSIKRLSLMFLALGLTSPILADTCSPFDVTVPNQNGGFTFGADALLMRGTAPNLGYGASFGSINGVTTDLQTSAGTLSDIDTTYQWGFDAMLGYRLPGTGNDLTLSWTHLGNLSDSDSNSTPFTINTIIFLDGPIPVTFNGQLNQSGSVEFNYDAVDLDLGQKVNFGDYFQFRMFAGARWADVKQDLNTTYGVNITSSTINGEPVPINSTTDATYQSNDSEFKGIGPQIGFDGRYCLGYGFGIDANLTASMLVGDVDTNTTLTTATITADGVSPIDTINLDNDNRDRVVPALDGSLGLDYTYAFANCDRSFLTIQAGYKAIKYFDVTQDVSNHAVAIPTLFNGGIGFEASNTLGNTSSSVAFDGPYAGIKVNL